MNFWMVRAGEGSGLVGEFEENGLIAIGWKRAGDLTQLTTLESVRATIEANYPGDTRQQHSVSVGQANKFRNVMQPGDRVVTYDGRAREYLLGTITGPYEYQPNVV